MRRRQSGETDERRAEAAARAAILDVVLPRLLRLAGDADAEVQAMLSTVLRRLGARRSHVETRSAAMENLAFAAVQRILEAAACEERARRAAELANDGTP